MPGRSLPGDEAPEASTTLPESRCTVRASPTGTAENPPFGMALMDVARLAAISASVSTEPSAALTTWKNICPANCTDQTCPAAGAPLSAMLIVEFDPAGATPTLA